VVRAVSPCYSRTVHAPNARGGATLLLGLAIFAAMAALLVRQFVLVPGVAAAACFGAVVSAALLISWGAEAAQFSISQGLAVAFIALLQVVPEFMVEAVIAWDAGRTGRVDLVLANATGSNRLLTGLGWPLVFLVTDLSHRYKHGRPLEALELRSVHAVEIVALLLASSWYLVVILRGVLSLVDAGVLGGGFLLYLWLLHRLPAEEAEGKEELFAPARLLVELTPRIVRRGLLFALFALGGIVMWAVAGPFLEAMKVVAFTLGVSQFAFVQWVAPFLTEFPEKVSAVYWARSVRLAPMALLNMVSSTVNQFTALVAMIPIVYALSLGAVRPVLLDPIHRIEIFLSFATTLYGVACLLKFRLTRWNANFMVALFLVQFFYRGPVDLSHLGLAFLGPVDCHLLVAWAYVALAVVEVVQSFRQIRIKGALLDALAAMRRAPPAGRNAKEKAGESPPSPSSLDQPPKPAPVDDGWRKSGTASRLQELTREAHSSMQLDFTGPAGRLEALYESPELPRFAAVVCHPHPLHGGTMNNHATYRLAKAVRAKGGASLRFNFRGVGRSAGLHDFGAGEVEDVRSALDFLTVRHPGLALYACGFSFGAWMALEAGCAYPALGGILCAGLPLSLRESAGSLAASCPRKVAVVQAEYDEFGAPAEVEAIFAQAAGPRRMSVLAGATHLCTEDLPGLEREATVALAWLLEGRGGEGDRP
jgi:alpha/beta superfamily hydrolase/Ca2+/Na+ antiporter